MKFGEKVHFLRNERGLSQTRLGEMCSLSLRTIRNYESGGRYPKQREVYSRLAAALGCEVSYLLSEDEDFVLRAHDAYGARGAKQAEELVSGISALFSGGDVSDEDKDTLMRAIQDAYWKAKEDSREKYTPKKYRTGGKK